MRCRAARAYMRVWKRVWGIHSKLCNKPWDYRTIDTVHGTLCRGHCVGDTLHGTLSLCMGHYAWDTVHGALCMGHYAWDTMYGTLCMGHYAWDTMHGTLCMGHYAWDTMHGALWMGHYAWDTMHGTLWMGHYGFGQYTGGAFEISSISKAPILAHSKLSHCFIGWLWLMCKLIVDLIFSPILTNVDKGVKHFKRLVYDGGGGVTIWVAPILLSNLVVNNKPPSKWFYYSC